MKATFTAKEIATIKATFKATFPNVKMTFDKNTMVPSIVYQNGPELAKVQTLFPNVQVIRLIDAHSLAGLARQVLGLAEGAYVPSRNEHLIYRGFFQGYIEEGKRETHDFTANNVKKIMAHAMTVAL